MSVQSSFYNEYDIKNNEKHVLWAQRSFQKSPPDVSRSMSGKNRTSPEKNPTTGSPRHVRKIWDWPQPVYIWSPNLMMCMIATIGGCTQLLLLWPFSQIVWPFGCGRFGSKKFCGRSGCGLLECGRFDHKPNQSYTNIWLFKCPISQFSGHKLPCLTASG